MRVLFVSSGNTKDGISPVVKNQGESLQNMGITLDYFTVQGKGIKGYLKNVFPLRKHIKQNQYHIVHAHYSLSAFVATIAGCKPLVVSLMGSDIRSGFIIKAAIKTAYLFFWKVVIVKSQDMSDNVGIKKVEIIPNGVNVNVFKPEDKGSAQNKLEWDSSKKHILFAADPNRPEKNFGLLQNACNHMDFIEGIDIHLLKNVSHYEIPKYMNASDVVALTSLWEGSPNVIKEAMACNRPIVCTDVGDVRLVFGDTPGCYLTTFDAEDTLTKLRLALSFAEKFKHTNGRTRIFELGLDSETIARRILNLYHSQ
jgi:glycosyltransferase involved in cell wall biosynthesis